MNKKVRNSSFFPGPEEVIRSTEIALVSQLQEQIELAMESARITRRSLARNLAVPESTVDHILESPESTMRDLCALAVVLGISFKVTSYKSGA